MPGLVLVTNPEKQPGIADWSAELASSLSGLFGGTTEVRRITRLCAPKDVADDTLKLLIWDDRDRRIGALICSPPAAPNAVARSMEQARLAAATLGSALGRVVLDPRLEGRAFGLSYAVLPYCEPLSGTRLVGRAQRSLLAPRLFGWLRRATCATLTRPSNGGIDSEVVAALGHLERYPALSGEVRAAADRALDRLVTGRWSPCRVLMHGDLWWENILIRAGGSLDGVRRSWRDRFVLIDWASSRPDGFAIFDLVRLSQSVRLRGRRLATEVAGHCAILECDLSDARSYLAAALGSVGLSRGNFSTDRFVSMADSCMKTLGRAIS